MAKARVDSIEVLKVFRAALYKFAEAAGVALGDAESDIHRMINWLDNEQLNKWNSELRKRTTALSQAQEALRMKKIFKGAAGSKQSYVDEEKMVQRCQKLVAEAQAKIQACKQYSRKLQKEMLHYKGQVQRFATSTTVDIPLAGALLHKMIARLETYLSIAPQSAKSSAESAASTAGSSVEGSGGMTRAADEVPADIGQVLQALRANTPAAQVRADAQPAATPLPKSAEQIADSDRELVAGLGQGEPVDGTRTIVVSGVIGEKQRVYLERLAPANAADSGWYLGPAEVGQAPAVFTVTINEALATRPDWNELLTLPVGSLVVLDGGVIAAVVNTEGKDLFGAASEAKLMEATEPEPQATEQAAEPAPATDQPAAVPSST